MVAQEPESKDLLEKLEKVELLQLMWVSGRVFAVRKFEFMRFRRKVYLVRNRNPGPQGQVRVQLALPSEQLICYNQDLSCPNNLNQGVTNESIS